MKNRVRAAFGVVVVLSSVAFVTLAPLQSGTPAGAAPLELQYTGAAQIFVVPAEVTRIVIDTYGAQGGPWDTTKCQTGGFGGRARATIDVTPGEVLQVFVGGAGGTVGSPSGNVGGFNGGGDGRDATFTPSRGGGGASDVRRAPYGLDDRILVAGGGGGAGTFSGLGGGGGGGAANGGAGALLISGGGGGTQTAGGEAGANEDDGGSVATGGTFGFGGSGGADKDGGPAGGGGGGGWFGGGGGGGREEDAGAGGGGGSSYGPVGALLERGARGNTGVCESGPLDGLVTIVPSPTTGVFHPVSPERLLDTRSGLGAPAGAVPGGTSVDLMVDGRGGVPPFGVTSVVLSVTVTEPVAAGFVTVYPCGQELPTVSNLNFSAGQSVSNQVVVKVGDGGKVCLFTNITAHLIADVSGWYSGPGSVPGARFHSLPPDRFIDTREGVKVHGGQPLVLNVIGGHGVPAPTVSAVSAVTMNVTVTEPDARGFLTVYPCGQAVPAVSNLNFSAGQTVANLVTVKVGTDGQVCLFSNVGTHLIADASGWFGPEGASRGNAYTSMVPQRTLDTRIGVGSSNQPLAAGAIRPLTVLGRKGVPKEGIDAVVLNVTATDTVGDGFVTVYPCGEAVPNASNLNFTAGRTVPNLVTVDLGDDGQVCLYSSARTHLVADVEGWFADD